MPWTCLCGSVNNDRFCPDCGRENPLAGREIRHRAGSETRMKWILLASLIVLGGVTALLIAFFGLSGGDRRPSSSQSAVSMRNEAADNVRESKKPSPVGSEQPNTVAAQPPKESKTIEARTAVVKRDEQPPNEPAVEQSSNAAPPVLPSPGATAPTRSSLPAQLAPPPPAPTRPISGVLCNGPISVPHNGQLLFKDLPADRLHFTFDRDVWQPTIHRESNGTQTLVMRSLQPGIQTSCDIRWEIMR
jgi:hypothetical protein